MEAFFLREKILWNEDWLFCAEPLPARAFSVKGPLYKQAKTERARSGPAARMHNDAVDDYRDGVEYSAERWSKVCLPHDFVIEGVPEERGNNARGFFARGGNPAACARADCARRRKPDVESGSSWRPGAPVLMDGRRKRLPGSREDQEQIKFSCQNPVNYIDKRSEVC